ncbi:MAG: VCBS repeat-containing protein, partial [Candidatus Aminicenantes bacterium]|nr:VCBS repeat-containing protein [Candidatus Aminicenantes bacterium]
MKKYAYILAGVAVVLAAVFFVKAKAQVGGCTTDNDFVIGYSNGNNPVTINVNDPNNLQGITIDPESGNPHLRLKEKGANFIPGADYDVTTNWRMTGAAADFNGDGFVDLVEGGRRTDYNTNSNLGNTDPNDSNIAFFVSRGKDPADPLRFLFNGPYYLLYAGSALDKTYEIIACGAGDFDGDGDADIAVLSWQGRLFIFKNLYVEEDLDPGGIPLFSTTPTYLGDLINDGYGEWGTDTTMPGHWRWESNIESVDIDGDGDLDLIVGVPSRWATNRWGEVVIFINNGSGVFSRLPTAINPYANNSTYIYGVCGVAAADFDRDSDIDFYAGSANSRTIYFYRNDGLGNFSKYAARAITIALNHGSCTMLRAGNLDGDQDIDLVLATDGWTANPPGGFVFWYKNDGAGVMTAIPVPANGSQMSSSGDLDSGALGDFDNDDDLDFFVADGNNSLQCYFVMNESYP